MNWRRLCNSRNRLRIAGVVAVGTREQCDCGKQSHSVQCASEDVTRIFNKKTYRYSNDKNVLHENLF